MDYIQPYLQYLEYEKRYSPHTIAAYRRDIFCFVLFLQTNGISASDAGFRMVRRWIVSLVEKGNSSSTINRKIAVLRSYFKYLTKTGLIHVNPMEKIELLKTDKNLPVFVADSKLDEMLNAADTEDFPAIRDKMVLELFYMTGIRLSELIHLRETDVDMNSMTVKVSGKRNKERIIPLTVPFCTAFQQYLSLKRATFPDNGLLFMLDSGKPLYERWVQRLTNSRLGMVTTMKKRSPHVLRHSFATNILNNGAELNAIKELLGHANLAATQVYTHNSLKRIKKIYKLAHPRA